MIQHLCHFKLFDVENVVQEEKTSAQLKSLKAPFWFFRNMQTFKILFNKPQFYRRMDR